MNSSTDRPAPLDAVATEPATPGARLRSGVGLNLAATAFNQGSTFAVNLVIANLLGRERFGEYTMVLATVATVGAMGQLSMGYTATRYLAEFRSTDPQRASRILTACTATAAIAAPVVALALALLAGPLATRVLGAPQLEWDLRLASAAVLFVVLNGFLSGVLAGLEAYPALARGGIASGTLYFVLCSALAWRGGLTGAVAGLALSAAAQCGLLVLLVSREISKQHIRLAWGTFRQEWTMVAHFAIPASATGLLTLPSVWGASAILAWQPSGYDQLAIFAAANSFRTMVLFLPQTINNVGMSLMNNERRARPEHYARVFWMNAAMTATVAIGCGLVLLAAGPWLLRLFGRGFTAGYPALAILVLTAAIEAIALAVYQVIVIHSRMWLSLSFVALPRDLALLAVAAVLAPAWGASGLAAAHLAAQTIALVSTLVIAYRIGLHPAPVGSAVTTRTPHVRS